MRQEQLKAQLRQEQANLIEQHRLAALEQAKHEQHQAQVQEEARQA